MPYRQEEEEEERKNRRGGDEEGWQLPGRPNAQALSLSAMDREVSSHPLNALCMRLPRHTPTLCPAPTSNAGTACSWNHHAHRRLRPPGASGHPWRGSRTATEGAIKGGH